jgi:RNA polymerase sigma factor (sigma-70 family)
MPSHPLRRVVDHLIRRVQPPRPVASGDRELLAAFTACRDEAAFAELVRRHGPLVRGVCRRVLGRGPDVDDAFQATFLLLARKAGAGGWGATVGPWLHAAAWRISRKARVAAARRCRHEAYAEPLATVSEPSAGAVWRELGLILDDELGRLPERLRAPLMLCYLEGLTRDEAARRLGLPLGTLKERLARGRALLRVRLSRRGVAPAVAGLAAALTEAPISSATAATLARAAAGYVAGAAVAPRVAALLVGIRPVIAFWATAGAGVVLTAAMLAVAASREQGRPDVDALPPVASATGAPAPDAPRTDLHGDPLPPGAVARLGTVRLRPVAAAEFTSGGKAIVTGANTGLRLWDTATGKLLARDDGPLATQRMTVAADGRWVAVESQDGIVFWEPRTGQRVAAPLDGGNQILITAVAFAPDGSRLAVATLERRTDRVSVRILSVPDGREQHRLTSHKVSVPHLAFTADGALLSIDQNYSACLHDVGTGVLKKELSLAVVAADGGGSARLSPNGRWFVRLPQMGAPTVWDTASGDRKCVLDDVAGPVRDVDFSADGQSLAALVTQGDESRCVGVWDAATGRRLRQMVVPAVKELGNPSLFRIAPDGRTVAIFGEGNSALRLWDIGTGRPVPLPDGHAGGVTDIAVTADGRLVVSADGHEIRAWDLATSQPRWAVDCGLPRGVAVLPDGRTLVTGRPDGTLQFHDLATGRLIRKEPSSEPDGWASSFAVTADGGMALFVRIGAGNPLELIIDVRNLRPAGPAGRRLSLGEISGGWFTPDGQWLVSATRSGLTMFNTATGRPRKSMANLSGAMPHVVSHDVRLIAADTHGGVGRPVHIVDVLSMQSVLTIARLNGQGLRSQFSPDGRTLAVATNDKAIALFDTASGRERLRLGGVDAETFAFAFTPDGSRLLTGHADGTILVWDVAAATRREPAPAATDAQLDAWWTDLTGEDAAKAYRAVCGLSDVSGQAVPLLRARLKSTDVPAERIRQLLADLDSPRYPVREAASRQLAELGDVAEPALRHALANSESLEQRLRLQSLVDGLGEVRSPEVRRLARAVWVLERAGTPETVRMLEELARGPADARLTQEARDALARLRRLTTKAD